MLSITIRSTMNQDNVGEMGVGETGVDVTISVSHFSLWKHFHMAVPLLLLLSSQNFTQRYFSQP